LRVELVAPYGWERGGSEYNKDLVPPICVNRHKITDTHEHSSFIFVAKADSQEIHPTALEDAVTSAACIWVTKEELDRMQDMIRIAMH
jgi:uncharacterized protein YggL (DUF469 family)